MVLCVGGAVDPRAGRREHGVCRGAIQTVSDLARCTAQLSQD